jgi:hypothetical protein
MADTILDMFRDLNKGKDGNKGERFVLLWYSCTFVPHPCHLSSLPTRLALHGVWFTQIQGQLLLNNPWSHASERVVLCNSVVESVRCLPSRVHIANWV